MHQEVGRRVAHVVGCPVLAVTVDRDDPVFVDRLVDRGIVSKPGVGLVDDGLEVAVLGRA